ncbi:MAG TPA: alpha/beta hydrolase [Desulfitobacteriaceae bacterium]|nr:alpha/beta hydrolase [Desulfitobacteriaceae bacterium]
MDKVNRVAISPDGNKTVSASYGKSELEKKFIVVNWDQRGSGKSYDRNIDPNTMTIDQLVNDGLEVTKILLRKFGKSKIYLVGHSWGSILGMRMIAKDSGLFYSYIGYHNLYKILDTVKLKNGLKFSVNCRNFMKQLQVAQK